MNARWVFRTFKTSLCVLVVGVLSSTALAACSGGSGKASSADKAKVREIREPNSNPANATPGTGGPLGYTPTGTIVASDGFDPTKDGFSWENYGDTLPTDKGMAAPGNTAATNLTPAALRKIFGDSVCANSHCDLTPEAQAWMDQINNSMMDGHCYGFSDAALEFFTGKANPGAYGASTPAQLNFANNANLQTFIAQNFAYQYLPSIRNAAVTGDPTAVLNFLKKALVPNPPEVYTIAIFMADGSGGHAVTPFAIEDNGNGQFHILVYDNNFPNVTRAIAVDTDANTWQYTGGINPSDTSELYQGNAQTQSLGLFPTTPALGVQPWTFGGTAAQGAGSSGSSGNSGAGNSGSGSPGALPAGKGAIPAFLLDESTGNTYDDVYLDGGDQQHGHLLITNPAGQHVGYVNGKLENTIPGAIVESSTANEDWSEAIEPDYLVPDGVQYTITLDGSSMTQQDPQEDFGLIAPGYDLEIDNLSLNPGEKDMLSVSRNGTKASFTSSAQQAPVAYYGVSDSTSDYTFALSGDDIPANGTISFDLPINGTGFTFSTSNTGNVTNSVSIGVDKEDDSGSHQFESDGIALSDGDTATLEFGSWSPGQSMRLEATQGGQKRSEDLPDQAGSGGAALFNSGSSGNSGNSGSSGGSGNS